MWRPGQQAPPPPLLVDSTPSDFSYTPTFHLPSNTSKAAPPLPIKSHRRQILYTLENNQVLIIVGETGSGKSTQIPQYLLSSGWCGNNHQVVITQPRRVAAVRLSDRVSHELDGRGNEVGYKLRFDDSTSSSTKIKFVTDGVLVGEARMDPLLSGYSVVVVDEAHERNINQDILLGLLLKILPQRPTLRVIVCSATIDAEKFLDFFTGGIEGKGRKGEEVKGEIISVDGRSHDVEIMYLQSPASNYITKAVETVLSIHSNEGGGDILVFLPQASDIEEAVRMTGESAGKGSRLRPLPLYAALPENMIKQTLGEPGRGERRAIFSTSIAETSLTLPFVKFVVDSGMSKGPWFDCGRGVERLVVGQGSKSNAKQRAGRAGRVCRGKCYRLYTSETYDGMDDCAPPEILRTPLTSLVLTLKLLGVSNIAKFKMLTPPPIEALEEALEELYALGAINENCEIVEGIGDVMAEFPLDAKMGRTVIEGIKIGAAEEVIAVAAACQVNGIMVKPRSQQQGRDRDVVVGEMARGGGDHIVFARIMEGEDWRNGGWCKEKFVNQRAVRKADEIRGQLRRLCSRMIKGNRLSSAGTEEEGERLILQALAAGHVFNAARIGSDGRYRTMRGGTAVEVHPGSVFGRFGRFSEYVVYGNTEDGREGTVRICNVSGIDGNWLLREGGDKVYMKKGGVGGV